ncbi:MAG: transcriptional repressor LexA [Desulfobacterales bacterium]|nr:transcriptional repressor LexA [Desulfobacterales bacterium]
MQPDPTPKQQQFLRYLEKEVARTGKSPSLRKAAAQMGVSHTAVSQLIKGLEEKGLIRRDGRYGRAIYLLNRFQETAGAMRWREVPIIGRIAAGLPLYAQQEWGGTVVVDAAVFRHANLFALTVKGDSMNGVGILAGDLVICEPRQYAENGQIIVALVHQEEATVKRFFLGKDHIELRPENPSYKPMRYPFNAVLIQGRVIGVHRGPEVAEKL